MATSPAGTTPAARWRERHGLAASLVVAVVLPAWALLVLWSASPWRGWLDHGGWSDDSVLAPICRAVPGGTIVVPALVAAFAWLLMIAAMMVPTVLPLVGLFRRIAGGRPDATPLVASLLAGYAAVWLAFGVVAHAADGALRAAASTSGWILTHGWAVGAAVLALAGAFQFSALKYRCLDRCRTPYSFVNAHWHGRRPLREAFALGFDHGLFCVGCCWALMLVMFVVGMGNPGWMLALAAAMAAEKNLPGGHRVRTPLGVGLVAWAGAIVVAHA